MNGKMCLKKLLIYKNYELLLESYLFLIGGINVRIFIVYYWFRFVCFLGFFLLYWLEKREVYWIVVD